LHVLYGQDDYSSAAAVRQLVGEYGGVGEGHVNRMDGASANWSSLREACYTMPLFALSQVIVVRGLLGAWTGRGEPAGKAGARPSPAEFATFAGSLPDSTQLILHEGDLTPANRYLKELSGVAAGRVQVKAFPHLQGPARRQWIMQTVRARGGTIEPGAVALLVERCTGALQGVAMEIEKLLAYRAPEMAIVRADVELLVAAGDDASGFELVDAISARQAARVVDLVQRLLASGQAPEQILALVGARIRDLTLLAAASVEGVEAGVVQSRAGWTPGRLAHLQRARRDFSVPELREAQSLLVAADTALKSRPGHERPLVTLMTLLAIAQRRGAPDLEQALAL